MKNVALYVRVSREEQVKYRYINRRTDRETRYIL